MQETTTENLFFGLDISPINHYFEKIRKQITSSQLIFEFKKSSLYYGLAKLQSEEVNFSYLNNIDIDDDSAIDRGAPTNPQLMAGLLKNIISSEKIFAHKARVIIPPEAAYTKTLFLPASVIEEEVREYILDPKTEYKIPVPIRQTDFSLIPNYQLRKINGQLHNGFFLSSIPKKITNQIIKTLELADLDLCDIELAFTCHSRLYFSEIRNLLEDEYLIVLDLNSDCTHLTIYSTYTHMDISKIAAIKNQNEEQGSKDDSEIDENISLSKIDIQVMCNELEVKMNDFLKININGKWKKIILCGPNSLHPNLANLLQSEYNIPVNVLVSNLANHVGQVALQYGNDIHNYSNIIGSGLGLIDINIRNKGLEREIIKKSLPDTSENSYLLEYSATKNIKETVFSPEKQETRIENKPVLQSTVINSKETNIEFAINEEINELKVKAINPYNHKEEELFESITNNSFSQHKKDKLKVRGTNIQLRKDQINSLDDEDDWPSINLSDKDEDSKIEESISKKKGADNNKSEVKSNNKDIDESKSTKYENNDSPEFEMPDF